ncbi:MAG TPA: hypothetical protein VNX29_04360 [Kaistia sp.]|nr:hypothetical protein [Kaistia sp.]
MIEPQHRAMVLDMFGRGLTIPAIHHAMGGAVRRSDIELLIAEKSDADRRAAAIVRRERAKLWLRRQRITEEKAVKERLRARREAAALVAGYRVLTVMSPPRKRKDL